VNKAKLPTHVEVKAGKSSLEKDSIILLEQIRTIDKQRLRQKVQRLDLELMERVEEALQISLGLDVF
jgi:mRNA interferase MazF